jgi:hypothetical protein
MWKGQQSTWKFGHAQVEVVAAHALIFLTFTGSEQSIDAGAMFIRCVVNVISGHC